MPRWSTEGPASRAAALEAASAAIRGGGIVAIPTETYYGLAAALMTATLARLRTIKGDRDDKPFPLLVADKDAALALARSRHAALDKLCARFWPAPLTLVFPAIAGLPAAVTGDNGAVAVRQSPHPVVVELLARLGEPITATSANPSGAPPPATVDALDRRLEDALDGVLDAGETTGGRPSTILDITGERPRIVRAGAIGAEDLQSGLATRLL